MLLSTLCFLMQVSEAVCQQMSVLNTNSRYLHPTLVEYTQELLATMPATLEVSA